MKFELDDSAVLNLSAISCAAYGTHALAAPDHSQARTAPLHASVHRASKAMKEAGSEGAPVPTPHGSSPSSPSLAAPQRFYLTKATPTSAPITQWLGLSMVQGGAATAAVAASDGSYAAKKNMLKTLGGVWAASAANMIYQAEQGHHKRDVAYGMAAGQALLSALCLWRGFSNGD
jgi:hypothetical protein